MLNISISRDWRLPIYYYWKYMYTTRGSRRENAENVKWLGTVAWKMMFWGISCLQLVLHSIVRVIKSSRLTDHGNISSFMYSFGIFIHCSCAKNDLCYFRVELLATPTWSCENRRLFSSPYKDILAFLSLRDNGTNETTKSDFTKLFFLLN